MGGIDLRIVCWAGVFLALAWWSEGRHLYSDMRKRHLGALRATLFGLGASLLAIGLAFFGTWAADLIAPW